MSRKSERVNRAIAVQVAAQRFVDESHLTTSGDAERAFETRVLSTGLSILTERASARQTETTGGREMLVHLNVTVPAGDARTADEIADAIMAAIEVGSDHDAVRDLSIVCPLADEV